MREVDMRRRVAYAALAMALGMSSVTVQAAEPVSGTTSTDTSLQTVLDESKLYPSGTPEEAKAARLAAARNSLGTVGMFDYYHAENAIDALYNSTYASYTSPGTAYDATDMYYIKASLDFIDECNALRAKHNLSALKVTDYLMACEEADVNWSKHNYEHAQQFNIGENLAWNYSDPFYGWYDVEKAAYESGTTEFSKVGHYLNIINSDYATTGFAISETDYGVTMEQSFYFGNYYDDILGDYFYEDTDTAYTTDEYRKRIDAYESYLADTLFEDVTDTDKFFFDSVYWARQKKVTNGTGKNNFSPYNDCQRGQMVQFLYNLYGSPAVASEVPFSDVDANKYYKDAVSWAAANGITSGTGNGKFSPASPCTREQMVQFLYNMAGKPEVTAEPDFTDVAADSRFAKAIAWAKENKITTGTGNGKFSPKTNCTRGQMVVFLRNYCNNVGI